MTATIVLLNGAGSAGKSSLAKVIQTRASTPFLHVAMDAFLEMLPPGTFGNPDYYLFESSVDDGKPSMAVRSGPVMHRLLAGMRASVAALAAEGNNLIVDDVLVDDPAGTIADYERRLATFRFLKVGVHAPLDVLEERERARGDRAIGLSRHQFPRVHKGVSYDLEVDTSIATAEECAVTIVERYDL